MVVDVYVVRSVHRQYPRVRRVEAVSERNAVEWVAYDHPRTEHVRTIVDTGKGTYEARGSNDVPLGRYWVKKGRMSI